MIEWRPRRPALRDYVPLAAAGVAPVVPGDPTTGGRGTSGNSASLYGVNAPGRGWNTEAKPLTRSELQATFGAVGTPFFAGIIRTDEYVEELTGERAIQTYDRMWRSDGQVGAVINVWVLPLIQATYSIQAASDDSEDVRIAQETSDNLMSGMAGMTWHRFLWQLYTQRAVQGHAVFEKCWTVDDQKQIRLRKLAPRLPQTLYRWYPNGDDELDRIMQRVYVMDPSGITGKYEFPIIPAQKLLLSVRNQVGNNFLGMSVLRQAYKHWYYKDQLYTIDGIAAAKNAMGIPVINEPAQPDVTRQASDRAQAASALAQYQVNERSYFVMPAGWAFDLKAVSGAVRNIMPSIEHHDLLIARSILAQFINVDSGGTLIAARDSSSFFLQALFGEAEEVADDLNPVIREMEEYNHPRDRYSTLQMQGLEQREIGDYLRGVAALITAGGLTNTTETENAIRSKLDLPDLPAPANTPLPGMPASVDRDSQGKAAESAEDTQSRQQAAGIGDDSADPAELRRLAAWARQRDARAAALVREQAARHLSRGRREGLVTVPRADGSVIELTKRGGRWETYSRQPSVWSGVDLPPADAELGIGDFIRRITGYGIGPGPGGGGRKPKQAKPAVLYDWVLGDGGKSGKHCPECVENSENGPYTSATLPSHPGDGSTYCGDACSCELRVRRAS